jgi:hypothetical protein
MPQRVLHELLGASLFAEPLSQVSPKAESMTPSPQNESGVQSALQ